jgi:sarcosine oxidase
MLLRQVPRWGAKLVHGVRIDAIEGRTVRIGGERVNFDAVIVAAGAWAGALLPEFAPRLSVRRRVLAWFRPETPGPMPVLCVDNEEGVYGMPASRGLYKLGLHSVGGVTDPDGVAAPGAEDEAMLARFAAMLLPEHDPLPVKMERCLYTVTPDEHFLIRPSMNNERVLLFSACSGHGFKYAPAFGQLAEAWLKDANAPVLAPFNGVHGSARGGGARLGGAKS